MPQLSRPSSQRVGQGFSLIRLGHQGKQPLHVEVAIGPLPTTEQRERIARIAAQIPGPTEPDDPKKQQGQHEHPARDKREVGQTRVHLPRTRRQGCFQSGKQACSRRRCYQEESTCSGQPVWFL